MELFIYFIIVFALGGLLGLLYEARKAKSTKEEDFTIDLDMEDEYLL
jgi:hypothetical protein